MFNICKVGIADIPYAVGIHNTTSDADLKKCSRHIRRSKKQIEFYKDVFRDTLQTDHARKKISALSIKQKSLFSQAFLRKRPIMENRSDKRPADSFMRQPA